MDDRKPLKFGGGWTAEKLDRVRKYLSAYTTALKNQPFELVYIDAFAGTGYYEAGQGENDDLQAIPELAEEETQAFIKGSARIALEVEPAFDRYVFIDRDPRNCAELTALKDEFPAKQGKITIVNKDANECLQELVETDWRGKRAVLFLDPYAMQVRWDTVKAVAQTGAVDMWYLFPLHAVNRLLRRDGAIRPAERERLNLIFGSHDWEQQFYQRKTTDTLFGQDELTEKSSDIFEAIKDYMIGRLGAEFAGIAKNPLVLRNRTNSPLFLLCFAAANKRGAPIAIKIAQSILKG